MLISSFITLLFPVIEHGSIQLHVRSTQCFSPTWHSPGYWHQTKKALTFYLDLDWLCVNIKEIVGETLDSKEISLELTMLSWRRWGCLKIVERTFELIGPPSWLLSFHLFTVTPLLWLVKLCFPPAEIEHALFLRAAIYPCAITHVCHTVQILSHDKIAGFYVVAMHREAAALHTHTRACMQHAYTDMIVIQYTHRVHKLLKLAFDPHGNLGYLNIGGDTSFCLVTGRTG